MRKRKTCTENSDTEMVLHKDVLGIISQYSRPKLWLYWIYNERVHDDEIKFSRVVQADSYYDACVKIFDENAEFLVKNKYIKLSEGTTLDTIIDDIKFKGNHGHHCCSIPKSAKNFCFGWTRLSIG